MSEALAIDGGVPVRDTKASPWPTWPDNTEREWKKKSRPSSKKSISTKPKGYPHLWDTDLDRHLPPIAMRLMA